MFAGSSPLNSLTEFGTNAGASNVVVAGGTLTASSSPGGIGANIYVQSALSGNADPQSFVAATVSASNFDNTLTLNLGFMDGFSGTPSYVVVSPAWDGSFCALNVNGASFPMTVLQAFSIGIGTTVGVSLSGNVGSLALSTDGGTNWQRVATFSFTGTLASNYAAGIILEAGSISGNSYSIDSFFWGPSPPMPLDFPSFDPPGVVGSGGSGSINPIVLPHAYWGDSNIAVLVVEWVNFIPGSPPTDVLSVTDTNGNVWTLLVASNPTGPTSEYYTQQIWTCVPNGPLVDGTVTVNLNQASQASASLFGIVGTIGVDGTFTSVTYLSPAGPPPTQAYGVSITTSQTNDLILAVFTGENGGAPFVKAGAEQLYVLPYFGGARAQYNDASYTFQPTIISTPTNIGGTYQTPGAFSSQNFTVVTFKNHGNASVAVPDLIGDTLAGATSALVGVGLVLGTVTPVVGPVGIIRAQSPAAGTFVVSGSSVNVSEGAGILVPNVVGLTIADASAALIAAGFVIGPQTSVFGPAPPGTIAGQGIAAGSVEPPGTPIPVTVNNGALPLIMPNVLGETKGQAITDITALGLSVFDVGTQFSDVFPPGIIIGQNPAPGAIVFVGELASLVESKGPFIPPLVPEFDPDVTVISQYANSPTILQLVQNMAQYLRQDANMEEFFNFVWNVDTAQGFGLDDWGRIVDISRLLHIPNSAELFGFQNSTVPPGVTPFNFGVFNSKGGSATQTYLLPDDAYRTLILTKALSNISATTAPAMNRILQNLFPNRGNAYVVDAGDMTMQYVFRFALTVVEAAIIGQSNALPHGAGVGVSVVSGGPGQGAGAVIEGPDLVAGVGEIILPGEGAAAIAEDPDTVVGVGTATIPVGGYDGAIAALSGLVAYWKLDETTGTVAADSGPTGFPGAYVGAGGSYILGSAPLGSGLGTSVEFNVVGVSSFMSVPHDAAFDFASGAFTINFWLKAVASYSLSNNPLSKKGSGTGWNFNIFGGLPVYQVNGGNAIVFASTLAQGVDYMITIVSDPGAGNMKGYVNGVLDRTVGSVSQPNAGTDALVVADSAATGNPFDGNVSNVTLVASAVSASDIANLYALGA